MDVVQQRCIRDFGEQWTRFRANPGYYGSAGLFADIVSPLVEPSEVRGRRVAEIGSGTGRIVRMLLDAGAGHVLAIEPSAACDVLRQNLAGEEGRVAFQQTTGERIPPTGDLDWVFSIGVLHHIPEPEPVVRAAYRALRPGGRMFVWLYGREGNGLWLGLMGLLRTVTTRLPHRLLQGIAWLLYLPLLVYLGLCRFLPLPLRGYLCSVWGKFDPAERRLVIYDQLNPAYARYYTHAEAVRLLEQAGFVNVQAHHRHGYSWSVMGERP